MLLLDRDSTIHVAQAAVKAGVPTFVFLSAFDGPGRYISTKVIHSHMRGIAYVVHQREAEQYLLAEPSLRTIIVRPGLMFSDIFTTTIAIGNSIASTAQSWLPFGSWLVDFEG